MASRSSLLPREHGAYAELAFPLLTGVALGAPSLQVLALASAAVAFFLANEPVAILLGARGGRIKDQQGQRAKRRGLVLIGAGLLLGGAGVLGAGASIWPALLFPTLAGALLIPMALSGRQKSVLGELLVVTAFSTLILPFAAASGLSPIRVIPAVLVWWVSFTLGTLEVHAIKARHKDRGRNRWTRWTSPLASSLALAACVVLLRHGTVGISRASAALMSGPGAGQDPFLTGLAPQIIPAAQALLVPAAALLILSLIRVHPRHLKRVGWMLVAANSVALVVLLRG